MFIKASNFNKLIKKTYKGTGLLVARINENIYIGGNSWLLKTNKDFMPNKIKAMIIELIGEFPANGEMYTATPNGNQMEIWDDEKIQIEKWYELPHYACTRSNIRVECKHKSCRLYQSSTGEVRYVNELYDDIVAPFDIDEVVESVPQGPFIRDSGIFWKNETTTLMYVTSQPEENTNEADILAALSKIEL